LEKVKGMKVKLFESMGFSANCYALEIGDEIALIDVGQMTLDIMTYIAENIGRIKYVLLTHNHFDHIGGVAKALEMTDAKLAIHEADGKNLTDPTYNMTSRVGLSNPDFSVDLMLKDGDILPLGGETIRVIHTPGHTVGGVCYLVGDVIFSGDTLFAGTVGRTDFAGGDMAVLLESLQKLASLSGDFTVYPGHEEATTLAYEIKTNPYFRM